MMYGTITGQWCKFDIYQEWKDVGNPTVRPKRHTLPSTKDLWLGSLAHSAFGVVEVEGEGASDTGNLEIDRTITRTGVLSREALRSENRWRFPHKCNVPDFATIEKACQREDGTIQVFYPTRCDPQTADGASFVSCQ